MKRSFALVLTFAGLLYLSFSYDMAVGQPPAERAEPPGRGDSSPIEVDPARDFNVVKLKSELGLSADQFDKIVARYKKLRADQSSVVQEVTRAAASTQKGPPSPDRRAKQEAQLKSKVDPLNATFLSDIRAELTEAQKSKFVEISADLDLYPIRGSAHATAINTPFQLKNVVKIEEQDGFRVMSSNGIPDYLPGIFPGRGNPSAISEQKYVLRITLNPKVNETSVPHRRLLSGVALNGVVFDPGTAEMWRNDPQSGWRQEAISPLTIAGAKMGLDSSNAHVQPNGAYHYHALPVGLLKRLAKEKGVKVGDAMIQLGWSADGFPIYDYHGYSKADDASSPIKELHSSYRLKKGNRPDENAAPPGPGGPFDGTYSQDFEYVAGSGDLDECNGRFGVTPEYPNGTYYYVITGEYPYIPRIFRGTADASFAKNDHPPGGPGGRGRPGAPGAGGRPAAGPGNAPPSNRGPQQ